MLEYIVATFVILLFASIIGVVAYCLLIDVAPPRCVTCGKQTENDTYLRDQYGDYFCSSKCLADRAWDRWERYGYRHEER